MDGAAARRGAARAAGHGKARARGTTTVAATEQEEECEGVAAEALPSSRSSSWGRAPDGRSIS
jgi:hypothetical protein